VSDMVLQKETGSAVSPDLRVARHRRNCLCFGKFLSVICSGGMITTGQVGFDSKENIEPESLSLGLLEENRA
jgi:hypothetical protein